MKMNDNRKAANKWRNNMVGYISLFLVASFCSSYFVFCEARLHEPSTTTRIQEDSNIINMTPGQYEHAMMKSGGERRRGRNRSMHSFLLSDPIIEAEKYPKRYVKAATNKKAAATFDNDSDRNNSPVRNLLVNGEISRPEDYPYFGISNTDEQNPDMPFKLCGGTLIHSDIFLTSAHCQGAFLYGINFYDPVTGNYTREVPIIGQHRHPDFNLNNNNINYDVLLLQLAEPIDNIEPVLINDGSTLLAEGDMLEAIGFGSNEYEGPMSNFLQNATFQYVDNENCNGQVRNVDYGEDIMCVDPIDDSSVCLGDSGGPLLTKDGTQVGVISFTVFCQPDLVSDGFARLSFFYDWIQEKVCDISEDPPHGCQPSAGPDPEAVEMRLIFRYDFFPEETTYAVRNQVDGSIEFVGPTYVPGRGETWTTQFYLLPGRYAFEVYDSFGDGLTGAMASIPHGSWEIHALYDTDDEVLVASGIPGFRSQQNETFEVEDRSTSNPTRNPTIIPTQLPTIIPTQSPTIIPTQSPTIVPTQSPSRTPSISPTSAPSDVVTDIPSRAPSKSPAATPAPSTSSTTTTPTTTPSTTSPTTSTLLPTQSTAMPSPSTSDTIEPTESPVTSSPVQPSASTPTSSPMIIWPMEPSLGNSSPVVWSTTMSIVFLIFLLLTVYVCINYNKRHKQVLDGSRHLSSLHGSWHGSIHGSQKEFEA